MTPEVWKPVVGHDNAYEVSDLGRVRSVNRTVVCTNRHGSQERRNYKGCLLKPGPSRSGHVSVALGKGNTRAVHQIVMEAFVGPCPEGHEVLHLNHTPTDNRLVNLKYGTRSENLRMDYAAGRRPDPHWLIGARWA